MPKRKQVINKQHFYITRHNSLIEATYKISLDEQRLLYLCILQINPFKVFPEHNHFEISAQDFANTFKVNKKSVYRQLSQATTDLMKRMIYEIDGEVRKHYRWVQSAEYHDRQGKVVISFSDCVKPYLSDLRSQFTKLKLSDVAGLKSIHSIRILEFITQYLSVGQLEISVAEFKKRLQIEDEYVLFSNLQKRVIQKAISELKKKSNMDILCTTIKVGRKVEKLLFKFKKIKNDENNVIPFVQSINMIHEPAESAPDWEEKLAQRGIKLPKSST